MTNKDSVISCSDMILNTFSGIERSVAEKNNRLASTWKNVITRVSRCGQNLYEHTRLVDLKNGILLIETDHPGWIQLLQMNSGYILKGLKIEAPELKISSLAFRMQGSGAALHAVDYERQFEKERQKLSLKYEEEEKAARKYERAASASRARSASDGKASADGGSPAPVPLPPELQAVFDSLKESMRKNKEN